VRARILVMPRFKPGDPPPSEGYLQWHEWADVQRKAGIRQVKCPSCGLWRTPQELSAHKLRRSAFQCAKCFAP
jgi:hypothetical protein